MAAEYQILQPYEFRQTFLDKKSRPDGRSFLDFRITTLNSGSINTADGSAVVKIGNTSVVCGIKAEVAKLAPGEPSVGSIVPNVTLTPLCSPRIKAGPPGEMAQAATQFIAELVNNNLIIDLGKLCIKECKWIWVLHVDLICLNLDGGLLDACIIAFIAALNDLKLPELSYDEELDRLNLDTKGFKKITSVNQIVASTFAIFEDGVTVSDPISKEEQLAEGVITITVNGEAIVNINKPGGYGLSEDKMDNLIKRSQQRGAEMKQLFEAAKLPKLE